MNDTATKAPHESVALLQQLDLISGNAHDMFQVATRLAGFDADELWTEIRSRWSLPRRMNEATVTGAMQRICDRDPEYQNAMGRA